MSYYYLPCGGGSNVTYSVTLEGTTYQFNYRYLQRETNLANMGGVYADEWRLYIRTSGGDTILETPLKTNRNLLKSYYYRENCPQGILMLRDYSSDINYADTGIYRPERVDYDNLGKDKRFRLVYMTEDEAISEGLI